MSSGRFPGRVDYHSLCTSFISWAGWIPVSSQITGSVMWGPYPTFPLFFFTTIPHPELLPSRSFPNAVFFPNITSPAKILANPMPPSQEQLNPVSRQYICVFSRSIYFGSNPYPKNTLLDPQINGCLQHFCMLSSVLTLIHYFLFIYSKVCKTGQFHLV